MENRNIYKMDDFLLAVSVILLVPAAFFAWPWLKGIAGAGNLQQYFMEAPAMLGARLYNAAGYLLSALACQAGGRYVRFQEKISLRILDEIGYSRKTRLADIALKLGLSEKRASSLVRKLSHISSLKLTLEGDRISRTRESIKFDRNSEGSSRYEKQQAPPKTDLTENSEQIMSEGTMKPLQTVRPAAVQPGEVKKMGTMPLILLMILFLTPLWPIALIYIIKKAVKNPPSGRAGK